MWRTCDGTATNRMTDMRRPSGAHDGRGSSPECSLCRQTDPIVVVLCALQQAMLERLVEWCRAMILAQMEEIRREIESWWAD